MNVRTIVEAVLLLRIKESMIFRLHGHCQPSRSLAQDVLKVLVLLWNV